MTLFAPFARPLARKREAVAASPIAGSAPARRFAAAAFAALGLSALVSQPAAAEVSAETAYILNSLLFLIGGFLVMFMAAGFAMLEAGLVRTKHTAAICLKNIGLYAIAGVMYYLVGYNLMYSGVDGGYLGTFAIWGPGELTGADGLVLDANGVPVTALDYADNPDYSAPGYAAASDWFFQMVFVATAASIVSGAIAERTKLITFFIFTAIITGLIYPIAGSWQWGGGWLKEMGFSDFAGSTLVHSVGGWAALAGCLLVGPRLGRYVDGKHVDLPGSSLPLATLGTFILWFGWFGFNGASQLAMGSSTDVVAISQIFANTNMAAAGGVVITIILTKVWAKKVNLGFALNGALAGLVSITAEPLTPTIGEAILIGMAGAVLALLAMLLLVRIRIDDVVGAIPVHLVAGIWGTMAVPLTNDSTSFVTQAIGVGAYGAFAFTASFIVWLLLKMSVGLRMKPEDEERGGDLSELGHEAYPEFVPGRATLGKA